MIRFLMKGLLRDRSRSLFPLLTVFLGVVLAVFFYSFIQGVMSDMLTTTAHFQTGHVRVMTRAYAQEADQAPLDLSLVGVDRLMGDLRETYPDTIWVPRIHFGGLIDVPDEQGETRAQGPVTGMAVNLRAKSSPEHKLLNIRDSLVRGAMPAKRNEILLGDAFARKLEVDPGDTVTLISSTMFGSMAMANFTISGTVHFGIAPMDRGAMIADIFDIRYALDMEDAAGEILGFLPDDIYDDERATAMVAGFNREYGKSEDPFSPRMGTLPEESGLEMYFHMMKAMGFIIVLIFLVAMSLVLWNAGLMGSLRRYGEIGVRLAIGEDKGHVYLTLVMESLMIGVAGSILGTLCGVGLAYLMQIHGIDFGSITRNSSLMISNVYRARVTTGSFLVGLAPGILSTLLGTAIAGIGIFKRQTSQLFKELET
ncbi:MAG TPA: ABC transporter permease [Candidatus Aminicenantes bacterium]|nr:ABC transporter permease [Candidatus Aminicenantes bacterium]